MSDDARAILLGLVIPGMIGLAAGVAAARRGRPSAGGDRAARAGMSRIDVPMVAAIGGAMMLVVYGVHGGFAAPLVTVDDRLRWVSPVLLLVVLAGVLVRAAVGDRPANAAHPPERVAAVISAMAAAVVGVGIVLGPASLAMASRLVAVPILAVWAAFACKFLVRFQERGVRGRGGGVLVVLSVAVAAALLATGGESLGKCGFGCAAIAVCLTIGAMAARGEIRAFAIAMLCAFQAALLACGVCFNSTPWWVVAALGSVAPVAHLVDAAVSGRVGPRLGAAITIGVAVVIAAGAVAPGIRAIIPLIG